MSQALPGPKLLLPFLEPFYARAIPLSWLIVRVVAGVDFAIHGTEKLVRVPAILAALAQGSTASLAPDFDPLHNLVLTFFEFFGGICIALGLFTRFFASAAAIELAIIALSVFWPRGGYHAAEYTLWWGLVMFAIALRGGGPYALDQRLRWEL
jgi:putative oxidoreductase